MVSRTLNRINKATLYENKVHKVQSNSVLQLMLDNPEGILTETCSTPANVDTIMYYCILQRTQFVAFCSFFTWQRVNIYRTTLNHITVLVIIKIIILIINKLNSNLWNIVLLEKVNIPSTLSE